MDFRINYDDAVHLDAEQLAECGIAEAYESMMPKLREFVPIPAKIDEDCDDDASSYAVRCGDKTFQIYSPDLDVDGGSSWGRATFALFAIVNGQLEDANHRFYAINGGNDLFGIFLTPEEATAAQKSLPNKCDWPYLPKNEEPWNGQYH